MALNKAIFDAIEKGNAKKADKEFVEYCKHIVKNGESAKTLRGARMAYAMVASKGITEVDALLGVKEGRLTDLKDLQASDERTYEAVKKLVDGTA